MSDEEKVVSLATARDREKTPAKGTEKGQDVEQVYCSFCGRPNHMVVKMIKGPGVNICSECIMICIQYFILEDKVPSSEFQKVLDTFWKGTKK